MRFLVWSIGVRAFCEGPSGHPKSVAGVQELKTDLKNRAEGSFEPTLFLNTQSTERPGFVEQLQQDEFSLDSSGGERVPLRLQGFGFERAEEGRNGFWGVSWLSSSWLLGFHCLVGIPTSGKARLFWSASFQWGQ